MLRHVVLPGVAAVVLATTSALATSAPAEDGVRWKRERVDLVVDGSIQALGPDAAHAVQAAARAWQSVGAATPELSIVARDALPVGYAVGAKNESSVRLAPDGAALAKGAVAVTVVSYHAATGAILDADIVLNGIYRFSDGSGAASDGKHGKKKRYDLQAVLTHELGHWHGLADDYEHPHAAMYAKTSPEDLQKRVLSEEDEQALLSLYGELEAGPEPSAGSCASGPGRPAQLAWIGIAGLLALGAARRRRRPGAVFALAAGLALASAPATASEPGAPAVVNGTVRSVTAHWEGGLIVSEIELSDVTCVGGCDASPPERVRIAGGRVGDVVQVVSHAPVPEPGARVMIEINRARM